MVASSLGSGKISELLSLTSCNSSSSISQYIILLVDSALSLSLVSSNSFEVPPKTKYFQPGPLSTSKPQWFHTGKFSIIILVDSHSWVSKVYLTAVLNP